MNNLQRAIFHLFCCPMDAWIVVVPDLELQKKLVGVLEMAASWRTTDSTVVALTESVDRGFSAITRGYLKQQVR